MWPARCGSAAALSQTLADCRCGTGHTSDGACRDVVAGIEVAVRMLKSSAPGTRMNTASGSAGIEQQADDAGGKRGAEVEPGVDEAEHLARRTLRGG